MDPPGPRILLRRLRDDFKLKFDSRVQKFSTFSLLMNSILRIRLNLGVVCVPSRIFAYSALPDHDRYTGPGRARFYQRYPTLKLFISALLSVM